MRKAGTPRAAPQAGRKKETHAFPPPVRDDCLR